MNRPQAYRRSSLYVGWIRGTLVCVILSCGCKVCGPYVVTYRFELICLYSSGTLQGLLLTTHNQKRAHGVMRLNNVLKICQSF